MDNDSVLESKPLVNFKRMVNHCLAILHWSKLQTGKYNNQSSIVTASQYLTAESHNMIHRTADETGRSLLRALIQDDRFFSIPELDLLFIIKEEYSSELMRLKTAYSVPGYSDRPPTDPSPSKLLYGEEFDEINRTLVGVRALRWIRDRDYDTFIGSQPSSTKLSRTSFDWICDVFEKGLDSYHSHDNLYTLITSMIINDLGKSPTLAQDYATQTGIDISKVNHDMILYLVLKNFPKEQDSPMVPSFERLTPWDQADLLHGTKLGSEFNFGQLAQAENVPACLSGLKEISGYTHAFELRFMEQLLDIAGSAGHIDHTCALRLIEPVFQSYKNVYEIAIGIINEKLDLRQGYDQILLRKLQLLHSAGWTRELDVGQPENRAIMRLLCMSRVSDAEHATMLYNTFTQELPLTVRESLVISLNIDGSIEEPAVQPTYAPAMLELAASNTKNGTMREKSRAIAAVLKYLAKVLVLTNEQRKGLPEGVTVVEREIRTTLIHRLKESGFRANPDMLDNIETIPDAEIAKMAEGYDWAFG